MGVISGGCRFLTDVRAVFVVLSGKCGKSGVDSLVMYFHYMQTMGVGWAWWAESTDITGFFDSALHPKWNYSILSRDSGVRETS